MNHLSLRGACLALAMLLPPSGAALAQQPAATGVQTTAPAEARPPVTEAARPVPAEPRIVTEAAPRPIAHELSPWSMFLAADLVVKGVMIGLAFASLVTWTILVGKTIELGLARRRLTRAIGRIADAAVLSEARLALGARSGLVSLLLGAAAQELELSSHAAREDGIKERVESRLADLVRAETQSMRRGMGLLATIGSTAPFVGLFGTVWGIMNSFIGISKSQTTNLAVVAPGIAEALLATAIGLVAAIPAVIIYNHFSRATRAYQLVIARASSLVGRLVSRDIDRHGVGAARAAE